MIEIGVTWPPIQTIATFEPNRRLHALLIRFCTNYPHLLYGSAKLRTKASPVLFNFGAKTGVAIPYEGKEEANNTMGVCACVRAFPIRVCGELLFVKYRQE